MGKPKLLPKAKRAAKPKHPTLATRKTCYSGDKMTPENTFRYMGGTWCRKCRARSRLKSRKASAARFKAAQAVERKAAKAALADAFSTNGKPKAAARKTPRKVAARKAA